MGTELYPTLYECLPTKHWGLLQDTVHENSVNYILQVPNTHRPDLSNKSQFIPTGLFYGGNLPLSDNFFHIDRPIMGPGQPPVQWVPGTPFPWE
jgi:hypothetical protein